MAYTTDCISSLAFNKDTPVIDMKYDYEQNTRISIAKKQCSTPFNIGTVLYTVNMLRTESLLA